MFRCGPKLVDPNLTQLPHLLSDFIFNVHCKIKSQSKAGPIGFNRSGIPDLTGPTAYAITVIQQIGKMRRI